MKQGLLPGCVEACPVDALTFGRRSDLIKIARNRMKENPGLYVDYVYGENDAGGTAWMVLAPAANVNPGPVDDPGVNGSAMTQLGLNTNLGTQPMAELTYGALGAVPMIVAFWPVLFGGAYAITKRREAMNKEEKDQAVADADSRLSDVMENAIAQIEEKDGKEAADKARAAIEAALAAKKGETPREVE